MSAADRPVLLRLRSVARSFSERDRALRHVDLDVAEGEFIAVMGPSGAGKSTLLNILGLLDEFTAGGYWVEGRPVKELAAAEVDDLRSAVFSFVFQASHVLPHETVERNAALGLACRSALLNEQRSEVTRALKTVGLLNKAENLARDLSGGERQRLAIARAIATGPRVLLADEPTGNLDSRNGGKIVQLLQELHAGGTTIVLITHDKSVAEAAQSIIEISDGQLVRTLQGTMVEASERKIPRRSVRDHVRRAGGVLIEALNALSSRPSRTLALGISFLVATTGLVAAAGIGSSGSQQVADRLAENALDELYVYNSADVDAGERAARVESISSIDGVEAVGLRTIFERSTANVRLRIQDQKSSYEGQVRGVDATYFELAQVRLVPSNATEYFEKDRQEQVAVLGSKAAAILGGSEVIGRTLWIFGRPFHVVGIINESLRDTRLLDAVVIPVDALGPSSSELVIRTERGQPAAVAEAIPLAVDPASPGSVEVTSVVDYRTLRLGVANDLSTLLFVSSILLLAVAALSAGVSMYLSIQARTPEIALRRALGASRGLIALMFMLDGALLGLAGGLGGAAVGSVVTVVVAALSGWTAILPTSSILLAIGTGAVAGVVSAVVPAVRAAHVSPALAIRG